MNKNPQVCKECRFIVGSNQGVEWQGGWYHIACKQKVQREKQEREALAVAEINEQAKKEQP